MAFLRTKYLDLIAGRRQGLLFDLLRGLLALLSVPYLGVVTARNAYYRLIKSSVRRLGRPVISIGNITTGGTGKTPVAAHVANMLLQRGRKVALILRGYKGRPIQFDDEQRDWAAERWRKESDEALVLKRLCPKSRVLVNPDRIAAARDALAAGADAFVLDDAFQHRRIARDLDIVLIDATAPFGYGYLLPRGLLREPTRSLQRADVVVLTRCNQIDDTARSLLLRRIDRLSGGKPLIQAAHRIVGFTDLKGAPVEVDEPSDMQAILFAGIGNFDSFRSCAEELGVHVLAAYEYPDHHDYTAEETGGLSNVADTLEANVLLTTEKDAVKLVGRWGEEACRLLVLRLAIEFDADGDTILADAVDRVLV